MSRTQIAPQSSVFAALPADPVRVRCDCGHAFEAPRDEYGDGSIFCNACQDFVVYERCLTCYSLDCQAHEGPTLRHA